MDSPTDKRAVEVAGRNWLTAQLLVRNIQVALPEVDSGIDLIAFLEVGAGGIKALPIQLKCSTLRYFGLRKKYEGRGILQAFIWHSLTEPEVYFLEYEECLEILGSSVKADSWAKRGLWDINNLTQGGRVHLAVTSYEDRWHDRQWLKQRILGEPVSA